MAEQQQQQQMPPQQQAPPQQEGQQAPQEGQENQEAEVVRNLMVNYIPTTIDEMQLRQLFEMYGPIESVKIVSDRETRASKGYGFVKYRFGFSAVHAIQYLNGYPLMNKRLKVALANPAEAQKAPPVSAPPANMGMPGAPQWGQQQQQQQQFGVMQCKQN